MQKDEAYYKLLVSAYIDRNLSANEVEELLAFIKKQPEVYDRILNSSEIKGKLAERGDSSIKTIPDELSSRMWERISDTLHKESAEVVTTIHRIPILKRYWFRWAAAAAVLAIIATTVFVASTDRRPDKPGTELTKVNASDAAPGKNVAILTLANGSQILLDSAATGELVKQEGAEVIKTDEGAIAYNEQGTAGSVFNTIATPRGGQYRLRLADGTTVWLNAASSLHFPTAFTGKDRVVELTGEAYFEVAHNARMPFLVKVNGMEVKVLGTHFNINSYKEEEVIKTTLLEGSVQISDRSHSVVLKPGQQAVSGAEGNTQDITVVNNANIDQAMAWKNGLFNFNKLSLQEVMRQLSRWYDVDVVYQGNITPRKFGGEMQRDLNLSEVLDGLKDMGVQYKIEGKKLIVIAVK